MRAARGAAAVFATVVIGLGGAACPAREHTILVTADGVAHLGLACNDPCQKVLPTKCATRQGCAVAPDERCRREGGCGLHVERPYVTLDTFQQALQARVFLVDPDRGIKDQSKCMVLFPCPFDVESTSGDASFAAWTECEAEGLNRALDGAMAGGLSFDDLEDPNAAILFIALYQAPEDEATTARCRDQDLLACLGLAAPVGGDGTYDITCASCRGGTPVPAGRDTGPCPRPAKGGACFLDMCAKWLAEED